MIAAYWALSRIIGLYLAQALGNLGSSTRFHKEFLIKYCTVGQGFSYSILDETQD